MPTPGPAGAHRTGLRARQSPPHRQFPGLFEPDHAPVRKGAPQSISPSIGRLRRMASRGCVALDEDEVRPAACKSTTECPHQVASGIGQGPADRLDVQLTVRGEPKRG